MKDIVTILKDVGAILPNSHFVGTSGRHMDTYITKDAMFPHTEIVSQVGKMFALKYKDTPIDIVVGPALGGIILSQWVAYHLSKLKGKEVLSVFTEKSAEGGQIFTRGYDEVVKGKNILVIEDTVSTGGSVAKTIQSVRNAGANIVAVCLMVNKDLKLVNELSIGAPFEALGTFEVNTYAPEDCPMCKNGVPINTKFGHGKKFLEAQKK